MPRNNSGTYTLPTSNPVKSNTLIESTNWAIPTMNDLRDALTDSLSRSGSGTMLNALKVIDGSVSQPGLTFNSESSTGLFRPVSKSLAVTIAGVEVARFTDTGLTLSTPITSNTDITLVDGKSIVWGDGSLKITGNSATDVLVVGATGSRTLVGGVADTGIETLQVARNLCVRNGGASSTRPVASPNFDELIIESSGTTGISFLTPNDQKSGIAFGDPQNVTMGGIVYDHATDTMSFFAGGSTPARQIIGPTYVRALVPNLSDNDTAAAPGFSWTQTPGMGMFRAATNIIGWSTTGVEKMRLLAGADAQLVIGGPAAGLPIANRGTIDINGTASSALVLDVGGSYVGAVIGTAGATYLASNAGGLIFSTLNVEKMRLTAQTASELLVGLAGASQFSQANRNLVEINGAASGSAMLGFDIGGVATDYIVSGTNGFVMSRTGTTGTLTLAFNNVAKLQVTNTTLMDSINGLELGWRDIPPTGSKTSATYVLAAADRGMLVVLAAGCTTVNLPVLTAGATINVWNATGGNVTLTATGVTVRWGTGTVLGAPRTLANWALVTVVYTNTNAVKLLGEGIS